MLREVAAGFERPVLLFSGGKDSIVLLRLAEKAFRPARFPFPLMHVDTGENFPEAIEFRDRRVRGARRAADRRRGAGLDRRGPRDRGDRARARRATACKPRRCWTRSPSIALTRDRRRTPRRGTRARQRTHLQLPRRLRPLGPQTPAPRAVEPLQHPDPPPANTSACSRSQTGPSSTSGNTSNDEALEVPSIYFAHNRQTFTRDGMLYAYRPGQPLLPGETPVRRNGPLPHRRRHDLHRRRRAPPPPPSPKSSTKSPPPASPNAAKPAPTTKPQKPPWKTAKKPDTSDGGPTRRSRPAGPPPRRRATSAGRRATSTAPRAGSGWASTARRSGSPASRARASRRSPPRSRSSLLGVRTLGLPARRRQPAPRGLQRPRLQPRRPRRERPPRRRARGCCSRTPARSRWSAWSRPTPTTARRARELHEQAGLRVHRGVRQHEPRGVRAARRQGPLRAGPRRQRSPTSPASARPTRSRAPPRSS